MVALFIISFCRLILRKLLFYFPADVSCMQWKGVRHVLSMQRQGEGKTRQEDEIMALMAYVSWGGVSYS